MVTFCHCLFEQQGDILVYLVNLVNITALPREKSAFQLVDDNLLKRGHLQLVSKHYNSLKI